MSDYSPPTRPGYTRTGKSLKAVRRYYAQKNSQRRKRDRSPEEEDRDERNYSVSKRKRSPDDDVLSKRIAAELKVTQEANEKRKDRDSTGAKVVGEHDAPPIIIMPRENGPTFVTEPVNTPITKENKEIKSVTSNKSLGTSNLKSTQDPSKDTVPDMDPSMIGCLLACAVIGTCYFVIWLLVIKLDAGKKQVAEEYTLRLNNLLKNVRWLAITSIVVMPTVIYLIIMRQRSKHTFVALVLLSISSVSMSVYFIKTYAIQKELPLTPEFPNSRKALDPLELWLSIVYFMFLLIALTITIKQVMALLAKQMTVRSGFASGQDNKGQPHMSLYLSPI